MLGQLNVHLFYLDDFRSVQHGRLLHPEVVWDESVEAVRGVEKGRGRGRALNEVIEFCENFEGLLDLVLGQLTKRHLLQVNLQKFSRDFLVIIHKYNGM